MQLFVGRSTLRGDLARYKKSFNLLELGAERARAPRIARLKAWREEAGPEFAFSVRLPPSLAGLEQEHADLTEIGYVQQVAAALEPHWIVIRTPASVTPSTRARERLAELISRLEALGRSLAWEPRGLWEPGPAAELAERLGVSLVQDLSRDAGTPDAASSESPAVYTRLLAMGEQNRLGTGTADLVAERLIGLERAYVVLESEAAARFARLLREAVHDSGQMEADIGNRSP